MQWSDEGIVIGTRRHGESSLIVELMTPGRGRHLGLVRGGRSRRQQPVLQPGNTVSAVWRARLDEHLGNLTVEPLVSRAARLMETAAGLAALQVLTGLLHLLPERDPHPRLYAGLAAILDALDSPRAAAELVVRFEMQMLDELGFGLDLAQCAAGSNDELAYVSPRTGRAVGRGAGAPYADRLLPLPAFLVARREPPSPAAIAEAFRLTGYFLARHVYEPRGLAPPPARQALLALVAGEEHESAAEAAG
jgi:DNA repair protein RecO (recombination protein O)